MPPFLSDDVDAILDLAGDDPTPLLDEMAAHGRERDFPIVGPTVGRALALFARMVDAERVFEFGSGFGYSAAWFADALPADGEIVLTDYDADNLAEAREFLDRLENPVHAHFEAGDAMETFTTYDGPFDVVLIDHDKERYVDAFELAREEVADGGIVVADNMLAGPVDPASVRAALAGDEAADSAVRGIADYVEHVRDDPAVETALFPIGEGIAVSWLH